MANGNWMHTRLVVQVDGVMVTPITSFTPTFNLNTEVVHSIEATHVGYVANPDSFTFSMTVQATGDSAAKLAALALEGKEFKIELQAKTQEGWTGDEWAFGGVLLENCLITSASPSNATINGAPQATFSGVSRGAGATTAAGGKMQKLPFFPPEAPEEGA